MITVIESRSSNIPVFSRISHPSSILKKSFIENRLAIFLFPSNVFTVSEVLDLHAH